MELELKWIHADADIYDVRKAVQEVLHGPELYDPNTGTWAPTGTLNDPRDFFTLTMLPTGEVLAAGGLGGPQTAELYIPASG